MKRKSRFSPLIVLILGLAMLLAACSGNEGAEKSDNAGNEGISDGSNDKNASSSDVQGKPLVVVPEPKGDYDKNFNPFSTNPLSGTNGLLYEPLAYLDTISGDTQIGRAHV